LINLTKQAHLKQHTINRCIEGRYAVVADLSSIFSDFDTNEHKKYITSVQQKITTTNQFFISLLPQIWGHKLKFNQAPIDEERTALFIC
jgi:hypothetical protein